MDDRVAWKILGSDPDKIFSAIAQNDDHGKIDAAQQLLILAKRKAKKLLIINHPDKGGDRHKFSEVNKAIDHIEKSTDSFVKKLRFKITSQQASAKRKK